MKTVLLFSFLIWATTFQVKCQDTKPRNCCQNPTTESSCNAKPNVIKTALIRVNAGCENCKINIEKAIKVIPGVRNAHVDLDKKMAIVSYYTTKTNIQKIRQAITGAGYQADDLRPTPEAVALLPKKCRKHP